MRSKYTKSTILTDFTVQTCLYAVVLHSKKVTTMRSCRSSDACLSKQDVVLSDGRQSSSEGVDASSGCFHIDDVTIVVHSLPVSVLTEALEKQVEVGS